MITSHFKTMIVLLAALLVSMKAGAQIQISYNYNRSPQLLVSNTEIVIDGVTYEIHLGDISVNFYEDGKTPKQYTIGGGYARATSYDDNLATDVTLLKGFVVNSNNPGPYQGCLTISGDAPVGFPPDTSIPVTYYNDTMFKGKENLESIVIPDSWTVIPFEGFKECTNLKSVDMPNTITKIGYSAFYNSGLTGSLTLPIGLTSIGDWAFYGCHGLTGTLSIPESVTYIGGFAFLGCDGLTGSLTLPEGLTVISGYAFNGCSGFTGLTIPERVTSIGNFSFAGCTGLTGTLTIPHGVTNIGDSAFQNCSGFTGSLTIPDGVTYIGIDAFMNCSFTGSLTIPEGVTSIGGFAGCLGLTGTLTIPESVTSISRNAFNGCSGFTGSLTIPEGVTSIGEMAFNGCSGFTGSLTIPEGVTSISRNAFAGCSGFTGSLTIPESVTSISINAFVGCSGFTGSLTIPEGVTEIGGSAFAGCSGFTGSLTIREGVAEIGSSAFAGCSGFTGNLTIPEGVTSIASWTFEDCSGFTGSLTIPEGVTSIGYGAFYGCSGFSGTLTLPQTVMSISNGAFRNSSNNWENYSGFTKVISRITEPFECNPFHERLRYFGYHYIKLIVPRGTRKAYLSTSDWNRFSVYEAETISETSTAEPVDINDVNVLAERTIKANEWSTICLPFAMTEQQVKEAFGDDVELADFTSWQSIKDALGNVTGISVGFTSVSAMEANHPYIIKVSSDIENFLVEDVDISVAASPMKQVGTNEEDYGHFVGTYVADTAIPENGLFLSGNQFWYSKGLTKTKAFRGYFEFADVLSDADASGAPKITISVDDMVTKIVDVTRDYEDNTYYTLQGTKTSKPQRGVYIVNGKKVVVR